MDLPERAQLAALDRLLGVILEVAAVASAVIALLIGNLPATTALILVAIYIRLLKM